MPDQDVKILKEREDKQKRKQRASKTRVESRSRKIKKAAIPKRKQIQVLRVQ